MIAAGPYRSVLALALAAVATRAFSPTSPTARAAVDTALFASSARVWFSTTSGNTQRIAEYVAEETGAPCVDVGDAAPSDLSDGDGPLLVGAPTWNTGAEQRRSSTPWDDFLYDSLPGLDLKGRRVAVFGCGDQESYMDYYCDAAGELYDRFEEAGCALFGSTSTDGYNHVESKAMRNGRFVGLMCDEDNQNDLSRERVAKWVAQLKEEGFFE